MEDVILAQEPSEGMVEAKPRKPGTFPPGVSGNPGGQRKDGTRWVDDDPLLRDMRHVYRHPEDKDRTQGHKHCREWIKQDRKGFLCKMADLARAASKANIPVEGGTEGGQGQEAPPADPSEGRARELIHQLLEECRGEPVAGG